MGDLQSKILKLNNVSTILSKNNNFVYQMNMIGEVEKEIIDFSDRKIASQINSDDIKILLNQFINGKDDFTRREKKNLPFIIYENECTIDDIVRIIKILDLGDERQLQRLVYVYFCRFDNSDKTKYLSKILEFALSTNSPFTSKILDNISKNAMWIFKTQCMNTLSNRYANKQNIDTTLNEIGLIKWKGVSNFVKLSLIYFFRNARTDINIQSTILMQIYKQENIFNTIVPYIADAFIPKVDNEKHRNINLKKSCLDIFYSLLGDPRFGSKTRKWDSISQHTKDIFISWLAEDDLELFFKIIDRTAVDDMWKYRKKFWEAYLPYIANTWLFLGKDARIVANSVEKTNKMHGILQGADSKQSVFVFKIYNFVFVEWSHNGKLRVFNARDVINIFGYNKLNKQTLTTSNFIEQWTHVNASNYLWQRRVCDWISKYCGINIGRQKWVVNS